MIRFRCRQCNALLQVDDDEAGKRGQCPGCGFLNVVPFSSDDGLQFVTPQPQPEDEPEEDWPDPEALPPRPAARAATTKRRRSKPRSPDFARSAVILFGLLAVATVILPWELQVRNDRMIATFSWNLLFPSDGTDAPPGLWVLLLSGWFSGLLAVALSVLPERGMRGIAHACLGFIALLIPLGLGLARPETYRSFPVLGDPSDVPVYAFIFTFLILASLFGLFTTVHIRVGIGRVKTVRIVQVVFAGLVLLAYLLRLLLGMLVFAAADTDTRAQLQVVYHLLMGGLINLLCIAAAALALLDAVATRARVISTTVTLLYILLILMFTDLLVGVVLQTGSSRFAMQALNLFLLHGLGIVLLGAGLPAVINDAYRRRSESRRPLVAQVAPDPQPEPASAPAPAAPPPLRPAAPLSVQQPTATPPPAPPKPPPPPVADSRADSSGETSTRASSSSQPLDEQTRQLARLEQLRKSGRITDEEYKVLRARLVQQYRPNA